MLSVGDRICVVIDRKHSDLSVEELINKRIVKPKNTKCEKHDLEFLAIPKFKMFDQVIYSECPECAKDRELERERLEIERKREELAYREVKKENALLSRGCGKKYLRLRNGLKSDTELFAKGLSQFLDVDGSDFVRKDDLIILGCCGIGKTFFGNLIVEKALELEKNYIISTAFELVSIYKNTTINGFNRTNSFENLVDFLDGVDCLIIDEIDYFLRGSKDIRDDEALHHIAQICEKDDVRTIILGNCTRKELKEAMPPKVYSRFTGGRVIEGWNMKDLRGER